MPEKIFGKMEQGNYYHIYNRTNNRELLFYEEKNYTYFLNKFFKYLSGYIDVYAYCLMPTHFHFLIRVMELKPDITTKEYIPGSISILDKAFRDFFITYAKAINKAYNRRGALFQQKYKQKKINNESHFSTVIYYIHSNPVKARLCKRCVDWPHSSYQEIIGTHPTTLKRNEVIDWYGNHETFIKTHMTTLTELTIK